MEHSTLHFNYYFMKNLVTLALVPVLTMGAIGISAAQIGGEADLGQQLGYGLQSGQHQDRPEKPTDVTTTIKKLDNGIQMTQVSSNADSVALLHKRADMHLAKSESTRTKTNIDNGIKMTITSDNAEVVSILQSQEAPAPKNDKITVTKVNLEQGVEITTTSDDTTIVERLQSNDFKKGFPKKGNRKGHGEQREKPVSE